MVSYIYLSIYMLILSRPRQSFVNAVKMLITNYAIRTVPLIKIHHVNIKDIIFHLF